MNGRILVVMTGSFNLQNLPPDHPVHHYERITKTTDPDEMLSCVAACLERSHQTDVVIRKKTDDDDNVRATFPS